MKFNCQLNDTRYPLIDTLKGLSVLFVVLLHLQLLIPFENTRIFKILPNEIWSLMFSSGYYGVRMFFVISGFLITTTSLRRWKKLSDINIIEFYLYRFAKIAPLLLALIFVLTILHFYKVEYYTINPQKLSFSKALISALTFHLNFLWAKTGYMPASWAFLWSLSVEEMFYIVFPLTCNLCAKHKYFFILLTIFIILGPLNRLYTESNIIWSTKAYLSCADSLAIGCVAALINDYKKIPTKFLNRLAVFATVILLAVLIFKHNRTFELIRLLQIDETIFSLSTAIILIYCTNISPNEWILFSLNPLIWYGKRSYEIYLTHMFILYIGYYLFKKTNDSDLNRFVLLFFTVITSGILGHIIEKYYSSPLNEAIRNRKSTLIKNKFSTLK